MNEIYFDVQGSAPEPYRVIFVRRSETNLSCYCSCPAGENGLYCKHRFAILDGITKNIVSENIGDVSVVQSWLTGTDVESALNEVKKLEAEAAKIKDSLTTARQNLAKAMRD